MNGMLAQIRHVILDRDGVLNVERAECCQIRGWSQWQWIAGARDGLALLKRAGVQVSVATNQSGIGRGVVTRAEVDAVHACMLDEVAKAGGWIDRVLVCPHAPDEGCGCRKPAPGLLLEAVRASGVPVSATLVIGDDLRDLQAARAADINAVLVRTGKGRITERTVARDRVEIFDDLHTFAGAGCSAVVSGASNHK